MYDPLRDANELWEQLASDKRRTAFLFGAGTSQTVGVPGMKTLTAEAHKISVSSSTIAAVGYEPESATLGVRFHSGMEYHYFQVPREVFDGFLSAASCGAYLDRYVKKPGYVYARIM